MIINTGSRTDIPAFFSEWFFHRIQEQYVLVRNPFYPKLVTRYSLSNEVVDCLVFCTKNPKPMLDKMNFLSLYPQYWFVTITPYGKDIEPNVPNKHEVIDSFCKLSKIVGKEKITWRYDPIFLNKKYTKEYHLRAFETMCSLLEGYTETCIISFIDLYEKTKKNFPEAKEVSTEDKFYLAEQFVDIAKKHHIQIRSCLEDINLVRVGVDVQGCLTENVLEKSLGYSLDVPSSFRPPRQGCSCLLGNDIGAYNTCLHLCRYCYANYDSELVKRNIKNHDPNSPLLIGHLEKDDIVRDYKNQSWKRNQLTLF